MVIPTMTGESEDPEKVTTAFPSPPVLWINTWARPLKVSTVNDLAEGSSGRYLARKAGSPLPTPRILTGPSTVTFTGTQASGTKLPLES